MSSCNTDSKRLTGERFFPVRTQRYAATRTAMAAIAYRTHLQRELMLEEAASDRSTAPLLGSVFTEWIPFDKPNYLNGRFGSARGMFISRSHLVGFRVADQITANRRHGFAALRLPCRRVGSEARRTETVRPEDWSGWFDSWEEVS